MNEQQKARGTTQQQMFSRAYRLYVRYHTQTQQYAELARALGYESATALNVACWSRMNSRRAA